jgi:hypothetical protein
LVIILFRWAFRNIMNAALGRVKDGESRASAVKPIFGDLIHSH